MLECPSREDKEGGGRGGWGQQAEEEEEDQQEAGAGRAFRTRRVPPALRIAMMTCAARGPYLSPGERQVPGLHLEACAGLGALPVGAPLSVPRT